MFSAGHTVGKYVIDHHLGTGGFGEVYEASEPSLRRRVALKFLLPKYAADPYFVRRFEHEANAMAAVEHPNVVPIYEHGRVQSHRYFAMRFVAGGSLLDRLDGMEIDEVVEVLTGVADGLDACHARGVIHRDVKPGNILVEAQGNRGLLADFGIALADDATGLTGTGVRLGTAPYMAPEQLWGERATAKSDLFALGCVAYRALTGALPRAAGADPGTLPPAPSTRNPRLDPAVDRVILRSLAVAPNDRHPDARTFVADLRDALSRPVADIRTEPLPPAPASVPTQIMADPEPVTTLRLGRITAIATAVFLLTTLLAFALHSLLN